MPKIYWYGPENGKGSTHDRVSHTSPVDQALRSHAYRIALDAHFNLETAPKDRSGSSQIGMQKGNGTPKSDLDYYIYLHDPLRKGAAQGIENGHWTHGYSRRRNSTLGAAEGPIRNGKNGDGGGSRWVEGLHVLDRAAHSAVSRSKVH